MSLFPEENILTKEIESWRVFADGLKSEQDKKLFLEMLWYFMYNSNEFAYEILVKGEATALMNLSYGDSDNLVCVLEFAVFVGDILY